MKKYRIKKVTYDGYTRYYPQAVFLLGWSNLPSNESHFDGGYGTLEMAKEALCSYIRKPVIEYLDFDSARDCK